MTSQEFQSLSGELQELAPKIPPSWGAKQNDRNDSRIAMFRINTFDKLEQQIQHLPDTEKNYCRYRWFIWKCAQCDEYLFAAHPNVTPNPNTRDQAYDIEFNRDPQLRFDVKGTVIPKKFRNESETVLEDPAAILRFFYDDQSTGVRNHIQNRLFVVHHSHISSERVMHLRCNWNLKVQVYADYCSRINAGANFYRYKDVFSDVIFIVENSDKTFTWKFFAV